MGKKKQKGFVGVFIKFGKLEHIRAMHESGLLFCNTVASFVSVADGTLRGDELENVNYQQYIGKSIVSMKNPDEPDSDYKDIGTAESVHVYSRVEHSGNLFCLYHHGFDEQMERQNHQIGERCAEFGSHSLIIHNVKEFLARLTLVLDARGLKYSMAAVKYSNLKTYSGYKHIFQKDTSYSWQKEFRLHIEGAGNEPILLEIGSMEDIAIIYSNKNNPAFNIGMVRSEI